jgi:alkyl hydroperoxide reductase subunit AhpF
MALSLKGLFVSLSKMPNYTQHKGLVSDTKRIDTQHDDTKQNDSIMGLFVTLSMNDTEYNNALTLCGVSLC